MAPISSRRWDAAILPERFFSRLTELVYQILLRISLLAIVIAVFFDLFSADRVFDEGDDAPNYVDNALLKPVPVGGWKDRLKQILNSDPIIGVWEPVSLVVKLLLASTWGLKPCTFCGANVVMHGVACMLSIELTLLVHRFLRHPNAEHCQVGALHAFFAALLIGIHPLRVETLAWASCLPFGIATILGILCASCHAAHLVVRKNLASAALKSNSDDLEVLRVRPLGLWRVTSAVLYVLACNAKPAALGIAPAQALLEMLYINGRWPVARLWYRVGVLLLDNILLICAAVVSAKIAMASSPGLAEWSQLFTWRHKILRASHMAALYILQQVAPWDLCVLHAVPMEDINEWNWRFGGAAAVVVLACLLSICAGPRQATMVFAYIAFLSPSLGIVGSHITETSADRYCHLCCMIFGIPVLAKALAAAVPKPGPVMFGLLIGLAAWEASVTRSYVDLWKHPEITIQQSVRISPKYYRTRYIHGMHLTRQQRIPEAERHFRKAIKLFPVFTNSHFAYTQSLAQQGKTPEAINAMRRGLKSDPDNYFAYFNLGMLLQQSGRNGEAFEALERAVELDPKDPQARSMLMEVQQVVGTRRKKPKKEGKQKSPDRGSLSPASPPQATRSNHKGSASATTTEATPRTTTTTKSSPKTSIKGSGPEAPPRTTTTKSSPKTSTKGSGLEAPPRTTTTKASPKKPTKESGTSKKKSHSATTTTQAKPASTYNAAMAPERSSRESQTTTTSSHDKVKSSVKSTVTSTEEERQPGKWYGPIAKQRLESSAALPTPSVKAPYLSIVMTSRHDDYAGNLAPRFVKHVALLYHQLLKQCFLDVEYIPVEWNPPPDRAPLMTLLTEGLSLAEQSSRAEACQREKSKFQVRLLRADPALHKRMQEEEHVGPAPMAEYFGKNIGIRAARGEFILVTNTDIVFSPALVTFLAKRTLHQKTFYTSGLRFDNKWPTKPKSPKAVEKAVGDLMKRALNDARLEGTDYSASIRHRPESHEPAWDTFKSVCADGDDGLAKLQGGYWDWHAGDFVVAARKHWHDVAAYPELHWTYGVDSSVLCKFFGRGLRNVALMPPCFVVHMHHRIRENPNARKVMDDEVLCDLCKKDPWQMYHPSQRPPKLWGKHPEADINETIIDIPVLGNGKASTVMR